MFLHKSKTTLNFNSIAKIGWFHLFKFTKNLHRNLFLTMCDTYIAFALAPIGVGFARKKEHNAASNANAVRSSIVAGKP
ncbi:MAG: hypothetical protein H6Q70_3802 [Firmicutes bacterium]|nr:hypothetical protein [Bacillota bacterium]